MKKKRKIKALKAQVVDLETCLREAYVWRNKWFDYAEALELWIESDCINAWSPMPTRPKGWHQ